MKQKNSHKLYESAASGISQAELKLPLSYRPLGHFLTLIRGSEAVKARALNWVLSTGLINATKAREDLFNMLLNASDIQLTPNASQPQNATYKVAEMAFSYEDIEGPEAEAYETGSKLSSLDIFSPEARKFKYFQDAEEKFKAKYGKDLLTYYRENFEPKTMVINQFDERNQSYEFDLEAIRNKAEREGLLPFYFGGLNGYIQFVEKGDYLSKNKKRSVINKNQQHGPSLQPIKRFNPKTKQIETDDASFIQEYGKKGLQVNFVGGAFVPSEKAAKERIRDMRIYFIKAALQDSAVPQDDKDYIEKVLAIKDKMKREDISLSDLGGSEKPAQKLGFPQFGSGTEERESIYDLPPNLDVNKFKEIVQQGLNLPLIVGIKKFGKEDENLPKPNGIDAIGEKLSRNEEKYKKSPDEGWWMPVRGEPDKVQIKFNKEQRDALFNIIFANINKGKFRGRFNLNSGLVENTPLARLNASWRFNLSTILNNALTSNQDIQATLTKTIFKSPRSWQDEGFIKQLGFVKKELEDFNPRKASTHYMIGDLLYRGFSWTDEIPFLDGKTKANLRNRFNLQLTVAQEKDGKWYIYAPSNVSFDDLVNLPAQDNLKKQNRSKEEKEADKRYGDVRSMPLMPGPTLAFRSVKAGHLSTNAVGKQTWSYILQELRKPTQESRLPEFSKGNYGGPYDVSAAEITLPSVVEGIKQGKAWFDSKNGGRNATTQTMPSDEWEDAYFYQLAYDSLRAKANSPTFQIGFTNPTEWQEASRKKNKGLEKGLEKKFSAQAMDQKSRSIGIYAILADKGVIDIDTKQSELNKIIGRIDKFTTAAQTQQGNVQNIDDYFLLPKINQIISQENFEDIFNGNDEFDKTNFFRSSFIEAFAKNGFEYRKRIVAQAVLRQLDKEKKQKQKEKSAAEIKNKDGSTSTVDYADDAQKRDRGRTEGEPVKDIESLYAMMGIKDPTAIKNPFMTVGKSLGVRGGKQRVPILPPQYSARISPEEKIAGFSSTITKQPTIKLPNGNFGIAKSDPALNPLAPKFTGFKKMQEGLTSFNSWRKNKEIKEIKESVGTSVVYDKKKRKPADGSGFNWWGEPGNLGGTSIAGEVETANSDPDGTKGIKNVRKGKQSK
jgi:hypothetical protein